MITLHIEDTHIRLMQVEGKQVMKVASLPLEPGLVENGEVIDRATVSQLISQLMASQGISDKQVVTSISGIHSIYRTVSFPHLTRNMVAEAAQRELARAMPVPLAQLYTSWQAVDVSGQETILCLVGLPRNSVDAMLDTLRQAGLQSTGMDITPLALARLTDEKDAIIINVQATSFDIVVMANGIPELLRSLTFPSGEVAAQDKIKLVKEELERTVTFYNSSHKENPITTSTTTFISGETAKALAESLGYKVKPLPLWLLSKVSFDINEYAVNIGLALKQVKDTRIPVRINIDARPTAHLPRRQPAMAVLSWAVLGVAIIVIVPLVLATQKAVAETSALAAKVNGIELQVKNIQPANALLKLLQGQMDAVKAAQGTHHASLGVFKAQHARINGDLSKITSLLPGTIDLTSISHGDKIFLHGNAPDKATILNYTKALRDTGRFTNVIIADMHEIDYHRWAFILTLD